MNRSEILSILSDWNFWTKDQPTGIKRHHYIVRLENLLGTGQVVVISGVRRSGKSFLMRQVIQALMSKGVPKNQILMVNFDDPRFATLDTAALEQLFQTYMESLQPSDTPYIFLDEIQEVTGWEKWVRMMHELRKAKIVISGSNARLLSGELATLLTGRHMDLNVFPLSFEEFLEFNNMSTQNLDEITLVSRMTRIRALLYDYLEFGGFPEVTLTDQKKPLLLSYYDDILNRDLIRRFHLRRPESLKAIGKFCMSNVASQMTFRSLGRFAQATGNTAEKFSSYLESAYLLFFLKRFSFAVREQEKSPRKVYSIDIGLSNAVGFRFSQNVGRVAENVVFLTLRRHAASNPNLELFYWKDAMQHEVDFVVKDGLKVRELIQVSWNVSDPRTRQREINALVRAMKELGVNEALVVTEDEDKTEEFDKSKIKFAPLWKWLLKYERG